jgi:osmotically-inducible protein OsmY
MLRDAHKLTAAKEHPRDLKERIRHFLDSQHYASFRKIDVAVDGDDAILAGSVRSFHERQLAIALCGHVPGVHRVVDQLVVVGLDATDSASSRRERRR